MKARVKWAERRTFIGTSGTGHSIVFGNPVDDGPRPGPSPMELMLIGTAGCSSFDVVMILERGRQKVTDCVVEIEAERADTDPKVFTRIHMHFTVTGHKLDPARVERAIELSIEKYCSASAMMAATAKLTHDYEIVEPA